MDQQAYAQVGPKLRTLSTTWVHTTCVFSVMKLLSALNFKRSVTQLCACHVWGEKLQQYVRACVYHQHGRTKVLGRKLVEQLHHLVSSVHLRTGHLVASEHPHGRAEQIEQQLDFFRHNPANDVWQPVDDEVLGIERERGK